MQVTEASVLSDLRRFEEAIEQCHQIIDASRKSDEQPFGSNIFAPKLLLATVYQKIQRRKEALALYEELSEHIDDSDRQTLKYIKFQSFYGVALHEGRKEEAMPLLKEWLNIAPLANSSQRGKLYWLEDATA